MQKQKVAEWNELQDRQPAYALVANVDLVVVRYDDDVSVLYGRCLHRGALLSDGEVVGEDIVCGVHQWDYRLATGVSAYDNSEILQKFTAWIEDGGVWVDAEEIAAWEVDHPQAYDRDAFQGLYQDHHGTPEEPHNALIQELAGNGLSKVGHHGAVSAMGVDRRELPSWDDLQFITAQLATLPQLDDAPVGTELVIGPNADKPLRLEIPLFVSDMSFGALSEEAKVALSVGAELAGTGICSGEGGMLPEEQEANRRYFYELASAALRLTPWTRCSVCQAFHFKGGQGAKTGTGGHLPGHKVKGKIAEVRGPEGPVRDLAAALPRLAPRGRLPRFRRRGARGHRRHPDRLQALGPARRGRLRRCSAHRGRLRHPRRPRRRHRRRAATSSRTTSPCPLCRPWPAPAATWTSGAAAASP